MLTGEFADPYFKKYGKNAPAHSLLIRSLRDSGLVACDCFAAYDATPSQARFSWDGDKDATLDKIFDANNTYSIKEFLSKIGASPALKQAYQSKFGSKTVTFTDLSDFLVAEARNVTGLGSEVSDVAVLIKANIFKQA